jgi:membrane protease subunit HflK
VVVDQKAGSMLYLPLDKLMNSNSAAAPQQSQSLQSLNPQAAPAAAEIPVDRTRDAFRSRDRESR